MGGTGSGRRPRRAEVKVLDGTYRADRQRSAVGQPLTKLPAVPRGLQSGGRARWKAAGQALVDLGLLTPGDVAALERLCRAVDEVSACDRLLRSEGEYVDRAAHAAVQVRFQWLKVIDQLERQLGLTPASRATLAVGGKETPQVAAKRLG